MNKIKTPEDKNMAKLNNYRLIVSKTPTYNERRAATFIIEKIKIVTGFAIPVFTDDEPPCECEIVVGGTNRDALLGADFSRSRERMLEYGLRLVGNRLLITGYGTCEEIFKEPYGAYAPVKDFGIGTLYAAFRFCERVLGYDFSYVSDLDLLVDKNADEIEIDDSCELTVSAEKLSAELPAIFDGAAFYVPSFATELNTTRSCFIFKSRNGEFVVYDGGKRSDAKRLVGLLEYLSGGKKPTVDAWLLSQIRTAHSGALCEICGDKELSDRLNVKKVICRPMSEKFYTETALSKVENGVEYADQREIILDVQKYIGAELRIAENGEAFCSGDFEIKILRSPEDELECAEKVNINDSSVVYKLTYANEQSILLLGDGEKYTSRELEACCELKLKSDILQIGHHGRASVSDEVLRAIDADVYIVETTNKIWYSDESSSARVPVYRTRRYLTEAKKKHENVYRNTEGMLSFELPVKVR